MPSRILSLILSLALALAPATARAQQGAELSGVIASPEYRAQQQEKAQDWHGLEQTAAAWSDQDGTDWQSWYYYGLAELRLGKADDAVRHLTLAKELSPQEHQRLELYLADAHAMVPNWQSAEKAYRRLLLTHDKSPQLWDRLRDLLERYLASLPEAARDKGETATRIKTELIDVHQKTLRFKTHRERAELWLRHAELLREAGREAEARKSFHRYLAKNPTDLAVWEWVFQYDVENADAATLKRTIAYMKKVDGNNPLLRIHQGRMAMAADNREEARYHYEAASANASYPRQQAEAFVGLGDLTNSKRKSEALGYYKKAIHADPSLVHAWERIVVILRAQRKLSLAQKYFSRLRRVKTHIEAGEQVTAEVLHGLEG